MTTQEANVAASRRPPHRALERLAGLAFCGLLLLAATYFFGTTTEHYSDDYHFIQRVAETRAVESYWPNRPVHVWRPLFRVWSTFVHTAFSEHVWADHLVSTLLHGLVCTALWKLLLRFGCPPIPAAVAALLFMVYPAHFEAALWLSCQPTLMSAAVALGIARLFVGAYDTRGRGLPTSRLAGLLVLAAASSLAAACLNEQPAGASAAVALWLGFGILGAALTAGVKARQFIAPACVCAGVAIGLVGYLALRFVSTGMSLGSSAQEGFEGLPGARLLDLLQRVPREVVLLDFARGAFGTGIETVRENALWASILAVGLCASATVARLYRTTGGDARPLPDGPFSPLLLIVWGLGWWLVAWVPVATVHSQVAPRLHYAPDLGLALSLAGLLWWLSRRGGPRVSAAILCVAAVALLVFCTMMVGVQEGYRRRSVRDKAEALAVFDAFGGLPDDALLVPVRVRSKVLATPSRRFNNFFRSSWVISYANESSPRRVLRLGGLRVVHTVFDVPPSTWALPDRPNVLAYKPGRSRPGRAPAAYELESVDWGKVAPFIVETDGSIRLVTSVMIESCGAAERRSVVPPLVDRVLRSDASRRPITTDLVWIVPCLDAPRRTDSHP